MGSKMCMNPSCGWTCSIEWKKGWPLRSGLFADLCHRCGCAYERSIFCETFHMDQTGWRECYLCNKRLHCGCIASKHMVELMDYGGVGCTTCVNSNQLILRSDFGRILSERQHMNGTREELMPYCGYRLDGGEKKYESSSPSQPSLNMALAVIPYSSTEIVASQSQSQVMQCSASSNILQKPSTTSVITLPRSSKSAAQPRIGRPPVEGRGKGHLLPRYWPKYTDKEVQQISGNLNVNIVPLFEKTLSASDAGRIGRLVLPKACAEAYFPPISQSEGIPLKIQDIKGKEWTFQFRFWPNNNSRMYVLEGVTPCIQSMMLQAGDTVTFSRVDPGGKLIMGSRKASNNNDAIRYLTNGTTTKDTSSSGVTETPTFINNSSKELKYLPDHLSSKKSEINRGKISDDSPQVTDKKRTRTIGKKNKRLLLDNEDSMELRLTWKEALELLRPSPTAKCSVDVIEDHEFEEFDEPPVFGKRTIITSRPSGEEERWASCDDCSKWRRLPIDALLSLKWTCLDNVWDESRCSCSAPEENLKELEDVLHQRREYKKRRIGESQTAKGVQEPSGLDALASAAVFGDTLGEPEVATTTRHPRHRVGCTCIVCIQPPSGKGRHKPNCGCNVCSTVKRRFKTLMMRRKKKQLEREEPNEEKKKKAKEEESDKSNKTEEEVNTERIDLNSDPYHRDNNEAVVVEKDESRREVGECSGVAQGGDVLEAMEVEGEADKISEGTRDSS